MSSPKPLVPVLMLKGSLLALCKLASSPKSAHDLLAMLSDVLAEALEICFQKRFPAAKHS